VTGRPSPLPGNLAGDAKAADDVHVRPLDRWQAGDHREELADLFVQCYPQVPGEEFQRRQDFLERLGYDVQREGFVMLIAETAHPVGCAYGYPVDREGRWWPRFEEGLPPRIEQLTAAGQVFALAYVMVHPRHRHHAVGRDLYRQLLGEQDASLGALLLDRADTENAELFRSWGWQEIGSAPATGTEPAFLGMARPLDDSL
jgi:GNAT superfamily N-acetyltransferase